MLPYTKHAKMERSNLSKKSESRSDKIAARVNSIHITKSVNLLKFYTGLWAVVTEGGFLRTTIAKSR